MDTNLFIKFLPAEVDDEKLHELFSPFGKIVSAKVMVHPASGLSLGYGFVRYTSSEEASKAIATMAGHKINNKTLLCKLSNNFTFNDPSANVYIKPLPVGFTEEDIRVMFEKFGPVITTKIVKFEGVTDSSVGFVLYDNIENASQAIQQMNGTVIAGQSTPLIVKYAESDSRRAVRKANNAPVKPSPKTITETFQKDLYYTTGYTSSEVSYMLVPSYMTMVPVHGNWAAGNAFYSPYYNYNHEPTYYYQHVTSWQ